MLMVTSIRARLAVAALLGLFVALAFTGVPAPRPAVAQDPPPPPPVLHSITPDRGPETGHTKITLSGAGLNFHGFAGVTLVSFLDTQVIATCYSPLSCTAIVPPGTGTVPVTVSLYLSQTGPSRPSNPLPYTHLGAPPAVTSVSPATGSTAGGNTVSISGTGFSTTAAATAIAFGAAPATGVVCASTISCTAIAPPGFRTVHVRVTVEGQTSALTAADTYTYVVPDTTGMTITGTAVITGAPVPAGAIIQALVGGSLCGQGIAGDDGAFAMLVASAVQIPTCGTAGAAVSFTINGQPATAQPPVVFQQNGHAKVLLTAGGPPPPQPPMGVSGTVTQGGMPVSAGTVQALVSGVVCGAGSVKSGAFTLSVAAGPPRAGCGTPGATVTFTVNSIAAAGTVSVTPGGAVTVALSLP